MSSTTRFIFEDSSVATAETTSITATAETLITKQGVSSNSLLVALPVITFDQSIASATIGADKICREIASTRPAFMTVNLSPEIAENDRLVGEKSACSGVLLKLTRMKKSKSNTAATATTNNNDNDNNNTMNENDNKSMTDSADFDYNVEVVTVVSSKYSFNQPYDFQFKQTIAPEVNNFEEFQEKLIECGKKVGSSSGGAQDLQLLGNDKSATISYDFIPSRFANPESSYIAPFSKVSMDFILSYFV